MIGRDRLDDAATPRLAQVESLDMQNIGLIVLVFAFVVAVTASRIQQVGDWHLGWAALALWIASELIGKVGG